MKINDQGFSRIQEYLTQNTIPIQELATREHKKYLGGKKFRSEIISKYRVNHTKIINQLAKYLTVKDTKKGRLIFKKLGNRVALDSINKGVTLKEIFDGIIFLKQAVWKVLYTNKLLNNLSLDEYNKINQSIGTYIDLVSSEIVSTYHTVYEKNREYDKAERKDAEIQLSHLAAIVKSSEDAIISKNLHGIIISWNRSAEEIFGYKEREAIGKHISMIIPPELQDQENIIIRNIKQGKRIEHFETVRLRKDKKKVHVSLSISPLKNRQGEIIGAAKIARDTTERHQLEQRKDEFISIASHELKTPLTIIKGYTQILERIIESLGNERAKLLLSKTNLYIGRLDDLIKDLLDVSKIQAGKLQFNMERFDLYEVLKDSIESIKVTNTKYDIIVDNPVGIYVYGDRLRIEQVFVNLLSNAIKYSPKSDKVIVKVNADINYITVEVTDYGIGIEKKQQPKLFQRFFRIEETATQFSGLGIGLYISSEIITRHGGKIWVKSEENKGSTFYFTLPIMRH